MFLIRGGGSTCILLPKILFCKYTIHIHTQNEKTYNYLKKLLTTPLFDSVFQFLILKHLRLHTHFD